MSKHSAESPSDEVPYDVSRAAAGTYTELFHSSIREILSPYNGAESVAAEKLLKSMLERMYYEGFVYGATGEISKGIDQLYTDTIIVTDEKEQGDDNE